jgi:two-component sensor histidine kinase
LSGSSCQELATLDFTLRDDEDNAVRLPWWILPSGWVEHADSPVRDFHPKWYAFAPAISCRTMNRQILRLQRFIIAPKNPFVWLPAIVLATAAVTGIRWVGDQGVNGFTFSPYFPVIVSAAALLGWRYGLFAALTSLTVLVMVFLEPSWFGRPRAGRLVIIGMLMLTLALILITTEAMRILLLTQWRHSREAQALNDELHHRTANLGQMLVNWIERGLDEPDCRAYYAQLAEHVVAWVRSSSVLRQNESGPIPISELSRNALAPFPLARIALLGDASNLSGPAARAAAMAFHELATNSTKYGALSSPGGQVMVHWDREGSEVRISWTEHAAQRPCRTASGTRLGLDLLASLEDMRDFAVRQETEGLICSFRLPAAPSGGGTG